MKHIYSAHYVTLGADPELFLIRRAGKITRRIAVVGSEKVIPAEGVRNFEYGDNISAPESATRDGVQVELHAGGHSSCRQSMAVYLGAAFKVLNGAVLEARKKLKDPSLAVSFRPMVELTKRDMAALSPEAKELNCKPSKNAYGRTPIHRNGAEYLIRTASGHLHLGTSLFQNDTIDYKEGVKVLDLLVGIPCVLVDRDPSQKIRRETYGCAGEYRIPKHGLEYRVPSNFWLRDYRLMSFVTGMAKLGLAVCNGLLPKKTHKGPNTEWAYEKLVEKVSFEEVERAINENDFDGAWKIYTTSIRPLMKQLDTNVGLGSGLINDFEYFVDRVREKGLKHWFDMDDARTLQRWIKVDTSIGWERFLLETVAPRREAAKFTGLFLTPQTAKEEDVVVAKRRNKSTELPLAA